MCTLKLYYPHYLQEHRKLSNPNPNAETVIPSNYSKSEEWLNSVSHGFGFVLSVVGLILLTSRAAGALNQVAVIVYGCTLMLMFFASTVYHSVNHHSYKHLLKLLDHSAIYLLIAGTYTPFLLVSLDGWLSWSMTIVIWSVAVMGVFFKIFVRHRFPKLSLFTYLAMGWFAVLLIYPLYQAVPKAGMWLLFTGGLCFSVGVLFYMAKTRPYTHAIWHLFVLSGCICHFFSIYLFVI